MMRKQISRLLGLLFALCCLMPLVLPRARAAAVGYSQDLLRGCDIYGNTNTETSFGDLAADAARAWGRADIALLPSEDFGTNLPAGEVTEEALAACLQNDSALAAVEITAAQLWQMLETGVSHIQVTEASTVDWEASYFPGYFQVSGLQVAYDLAAPAGERVYQLTLEDGTAVNPRDQETRYRVVSTRALLLGGYGYPAFDEEKLEDAGTELEAVMAYFRAHETVTRPETRVRIYGTRDWVFRHRSSILLILVALCLVIAQFTRRRKRERDVWHTSRTATAQEAAAVPEGVPPQPISERK